MGNIFGKKSSRSGKQPAITEQDRAVLVNRQNEEFYLFFLSFQLAIKTTTRSVESKSKTNRKST